MTSVPGSACGILGLQQPQATVEATLMNLGSKLSDFWRWFQGELFPALAEEVGRSDGGRRSRRRAVPRGRRSHHARPHRTDAALHRRGGRYGRRRKRRVPFRPRPATAAGVGSRRRVLASRRYRRGPGRSSRR